MIPHWRTLFVLSALALTTTTSPTALASGSFGNDSGNAAASRPVDPDFARAEKALVAKDWPGAIDLLSRVVARDTANADAYNYLGYAERNRGNLDAAFKYYERALAIAPKHRAAREYLGEAYLLAGNLAKAEEQLAALDKLCFFSCEEYRELKDKIADYKQKHAPNNTAASLN